MFIDVLCWWFIGDISMDVPWTKAWCHIKSAEPYPAYANPYPLLIAFVGAFLRWWWWWWWCLAKTFGMGWNHQPDWLACLQISMVALISPILSDNERTYDILRLTYGHVCWKNPRPKVTQHSQGLYTAIWSIIAPMPHYIPMTIPMDIM